jgi:C4-dicarboxylate-specific signal transduction histidine kinase
VTGRLAAAVAHELNNPLETLSNLVYFCGATSLDSTTRECVEIPTKNCEGRRM